jgi:hypothetical protein
VKLIFMLAALIAFVGCSESSQGHTIEQDLSACKTVCGARPIDEFSRLSIDGSFMCHCGKLPDSTSACPDAGAAKLQFGTW